MRHDPRIDAVGAQWADPARYQPLRVTLETETPIGGPHPLHLDGLLAAGMIQRALQGEHLEPSSDPYHLPLPVVCIWQHPVTKLPLWATTDFVPVGMTVVDVVRWYRYGIPAALVQRKRGKPYAPMTTKGPDKYMQEALTVREARAWYADAIGDAAAIGDLLSALGSHIGKKRSQGFGKVLAWHIEPQRTWSLLDEQSFLLRPVPMEATNWLSLPAGTEVPLPIVDGWTPPYYPGVLGTHAPCLPAGTKVHASLLPELSRTTRS